MTHGEAVKIVESYGCKIDRGNYWMPISMKWKQESKDFNEAANYLFTEWDYTFNYEEQ
jgi:hypothetical protein